MPSANTFKYQTLWTKDYQKSNWAMPVYPVIADMQFQKDLQIGDTVKRRYRTNPIFTNDLAAALTLTDRIKEGLIRVNQPTTGVDFHAPFGGTGTSSYGPREQGLAAREHYTSTHTVAIAPG